MNEDACFQLAFATISNYLPYHDRKAVKYAFYNSVAIVCLLSIMCLSAIIFLVFQVFLRPLVWALLVGTCLFPCKRILTRHLRQYLQHQKTTGYPFCLSVLLTPIQIMHSSAENLLDAFWSKLLPITVTVLSTGALIYMQEFGLFTLCCGYLTSVHASMSKLFALVSFIFSPLIVVALIATHLLVVITGFFPLSMFLVKALSSFLWLLISVTFSSWFGFLQPVIVVGMLVFIASSLLFPCTGKL